MILVPVRGDKIHVRDDAGKISVEQISDLAALAKYKRDVFPSAYIRTIGGAARSVQFKNIIKINDIHVDFDESTNTFTSQGIVKRKFNLPQIGEKYKSFKFSGEKVIKSLKLMNDNSHYNEIMVSFEDEEASTDDIAKSDDAPEKASSDEWYTLRDLVIKNISQFERYYFDYIHQG